eukprot:TRINITY_DN26429_c0_g1_i1.p1 TRINITY_DN26429_c0_g1~~TRINITY_DN26429_c0_g1_i1.p1  ORF type:complete len:163 (-),score=7.65 TRINITY_DN26429_c0_g1_i1:23-490(-)
MYRSIKFGGKVPGNPGWTCDTVEIGKGQHTSPDWKGAGWYRFTGEDAVEMPEVSAGNNHCGGRISGYLKSKHPEEPGEQVAATYCFEVVGEPCGTKYTGRVTNCGDYFVYYLKELNCDLRYCGTASTTKPEKSNEDFSPLLPFAQMMPFANPFLG